MPRRVRWKLSRFLPYFALKAAVEEVRPLPRLTHTWQSKGCSLQLQDGHLASCYIILASFAIKYLRVFVR